ncbi:peptidase M61 [Sphingomonas sp. Leaf33]|uniref:M61 family metallopeptidase n=1 Tax=Sphingomonas sp. Leaf33 TaxID=1736215 RepID=UPI0006F53F0D|nr:M61 family metallopeptidase [Sphingomonas sp. Leaf33]KQN25378.1 peptidase M61 [Sphingomonas sp. Leaf33]
MNRTLALAALLLASTAAPQTVGAQAQNSQPAATAPFTTRIPDARDIAYPGVIELDVDATNIGQGIYRVKQRVPVAEAGPLTLLMPAWLPGKHGPRGEIEKLAGLKITANGKTLAWTRDPVDVYAFHVDVPAGAKAVDLDFQFLGATAGNQGRISIAPNMLNLQFEQVSLYPAGYYTRRIPIQATVKYPAGWTAASGLPSRANGSTYAYQQTDYETLVDSPVFAGRYFKRWELTPRVGLNVVADSADELTAATPEMIDKHKALVAQSVKLFGAQHYDKYEFLLAITDEMGGIGLEHHRSSENGVDLGYFKEWKDAVGDRDLLPHEFTHSWNGKFRRGADLWTSDFRTPMRDNLLWVYEGQTQFWGLILGGRSGMLSKDEVLDNLALWAAGQDLTKGRQWRPLVDTTHDPIISARRPKGWQNWQRNEDYYVGGALVWLEADAIIRERTRGAKSMDDFARAFFGVRDGDWGTLTYTFDDVAKTLNDVTPYDWATFLKERVYDVNSAPTINGLTRNGYRLVYTDTPNAVAKSGEKGSKSTSFAFSLGMTVASDGSVRAVVWDSPAFNAGLDVATTVVAVNGDAYSADKLKAAVTAAKTSKDPIKLLVKNGAKFRDVALDYHDGLRYPRLEKVGTGETGLDRLLAAK